MISAANTHQQALDDTNRSVALPVSQDIPISNSSSSSPSIQAADVLATGSLDDLIPTWKRFLDLSLILLTSPFWLTLMGFVSFWILILSPGPVLYRQERIGYRSRRFMILKFRTMHVNSETLTHEGYFEKLMQSNCPMTKLDSCGDVRLIRGGRILRALGLDELPQLFNVVRGEMSLVGPRPCTPHEFDHYRPEQKLRVNAPPGLTGYWQVNGKNKTSFSQMISMDIYYGEHMSVLMDLVIILKTIPTIGIQVGESIRRKTGARINKLWQQYGVDGTAPPDAARGELQEDRRRNT